MNAQEHFLARLVLRPLATQVLPQNLKPAAVLVPLLKTSRGFEVLFTKRSQFLRHHAGQVCFAGGKQDLADGSLQETAIRECFEETGLMPSKILAKLAQIETSSGFAVQPFVGILSSLDGLNISEREVEKVFLVPLADLLNSDNYQRIKMFKNGVERTAFVIATPNCCELIWGATAAILYGLSQLNLANHN